MKQIFGAATVLALAVSPIVAFAETIPGKELAQQVFGSIETNADGAVDLKGFTQIGDDIFVSMDANDDGSISFEEFSSWDFGFDYIAEENGKLPAFNTAKRIVFSYWDWNGDKEISREEYSKSVELDFHRADANGDAALTEDEFLQGYIVNLAYRAALTGA